MLRYLNANIKDKNRQVKIFLAYFNVINNNINYYHNYLNIN
jgi:hypothetical protein